MKEIKIEKVTLNIGTGGPGDRLEKGMKLLNKITGMKAVPTTTNERIPTWEIRPGLQIGCKVTVRGKKAEELLGRLIKADQDKVTSLKFDVHGNFSFGIHEYIDIQGVPYDSTIGIIGLNVAVTLERAGFRVKKRNLRQRKIPARHKITKEEAINFINQKYSLGVN